MAKSVRFSDLLKEITSITLTLDNKLVVFYPVNRYYALDEFKPDWFRCFFPGGFIGMYTFTGIKTASRLDTKYVIAYKLDLGALCRIPDSDIKIKKDYIEFWVDGQLWFTIMKGICKIVNPGVLGYLVEAVVFQNANNLLGWRSKQWKEFCEYQYVAV